jgi:mono/diheme cytochrome c family protein
MFTRSSYYQLALIGLGVVATGLFGVFLHRELFPEYKLYQNAFVDLEEFRASYTEVPPAPFKESVKQIVILSPEKGEPTIDRCVSCHVTLDIDHYSPTKIATDVNGQPVYDDEGNPVKISNPDYIWKKLGDKIIELRDVQVNNQMLSAGESEKVEKRLKEADRLEALQTVQVGEQVYDMSKVLAMHPLIGRETHPFEYHSLEHYGCVTCHSGNGRGLVTDKAHGPVFDGTYEVAFEGLTPKFTETDPDNDPLFSKVFNHQPGHALIFQTTPILVGSLMQAKCVQCHQPISEDISSSLYNVELATSRKKKQTEVVQESLNGDIKAFLSLVALKNRLNRDGYAATVAWLNKSVEDYTQAPDVLQGRVGQRDYVEKARKPGLPTEELQKQLLQIINRDLMQLVGSGELENQLSELAKGEGDESASHVKKFLREHSDSRQLSGALFAKTAEIEKGKERLEQIKEAGASLQNITTDKQILKTLATDIDELTQSFQKGEQLYVSQACYACHRISGLFRGGVGPELTRVGLNYPWFIKESIVWPQADLATSTMPNFRLDHADLENLMTFLLAQRGAPQSISQIEYQTHVRVWESGEKMPIERSIPVEKLHDLHTAMVVFGTEGCAACHRLKGFESNVGFRLEQQEKSDPTSLYNEHQWFRNLVPEEIIGSELVEILDTHAAEIDERIVSDVRQGSVLETLDEVIPDNVISYYSPFHYALRAKDHYYRAKAEAEKDPEKRAEILAQAKKWHDRVHRVLMQFVQEYGLGRLIGPRLNWSGVFRSDQWMMEHFWKPTSHSPNSIMPVMPFDNTKFYALTNMLDQLAQKNSNELRQVWERDGFSPEAAFQLYCAQCHGPTLRGNGPVSEWIYPIPKNLRNADFLRNLTKEQAIISITHGIKGTPMPPWGEVASGKETDTKPVLTQGQIRQLVDWIFSSVEGTTPIEVPKWQYTPRDVIDEMNREGNVLKGGVVGSSKTLSAELALAEKSRDGEVEKLFDVLPNPLAGPDHELYYIKKKYYTTDNLEEGRTLFIANCSVCHGKEAVGDGTRAETMTESKPRMFTNLDWLHTRDDLRLLRSIKYGVPGTSMTPWGDYTNTLQRMQMVMYIRSLTHESDSRMKLDSALYQVFETNVQEVDVKRAQLAASIQALRAQLKQLQDKQSLLYQMLEEGKGDAKEIVDFHQKETELSTQLKRDEAQDADYLSLIARLKKESDAYRILGETILSSKVDDGMSEQLLKMVMLNKDRYQIQEGQLVSNPEKEKQIAEEGKEVVKILDAKLKELQRELTLEKAKIPSGEGRERLSELNSEIVTVTRLKNKLTSFLGRAASE